MKLALLSLLLGTSAFAADDVVGWRIDGSGQYPAANPPLQWSQDQNIVWKTKMPDWSNAHVILLGDKIFANSEPSTLVCIDRNTGKILWERSSTYGDVLGEEEVAKRRAAVASQVEPVEKELAEVQERLQGLFAEMRKERTKEIEGKIRGARLKQRELKQRIASIDPLHMPDKHRDNGYTSAVPVSDGEGLFVVYGNGVVSRFDLEGNRSWSKLLEKPKHGWGHSATPVLSGDLAIVHILDVVALDKKTGEEKWRTPAKEGWGTPLLTEIGGEPVLITATEGDIIRISDGKKVAEKVGGLKFATPIIEDGILYNIENRATAIRLPTSLDNFTPETLWQSRIKGSRHYASSAIHDGLIYAVSREGWLSVLDQGDGTLIYEKELGINGDNTNSVYPSVSVAGGHVFIGFEEGVVLVLKPGKAYEEVARNELEKFRGTPVFFEDKVYLRGLEHLYAISKR